MKPSLKSIVLNGYETWEITSILEGYQRDLEVEKMNITEEFQ